MAIELDLKRHLNAKLSEIIEDRRADIVNGSCRNLEDYRARCGYLKAIQDVLELISQWEKEKNDSLLNKQRS